MRRPRHTSDGGSFGRSAGMAAGRGAALLAVAVVLGVVLLNAADDPAPGRLTTGGSGGTSSTSVTTSTGRSTTVVTLPVRAPADVRVISANGTAVKGVARKVTDQLKAAGYNVLAPTDGQKTTASAVYFVGDFMREAQAVAASLGLPAASVQPFPAPAPLADARGATVIVLVGPELAQRVGSTTATTAAGAVTTTTGAAGTTASSTTTTKP